MKDKQTLKAPPEMVAAVSKYTDAMFELAASSFAACRVMALGMQILGWAVSAGLVADLVNEMVKWLKKNEPEDADEIINRRDNYTLEF